MKSKLKKVTVKCLDWTEEFSIDPNIFDDVYMEAATRALEKRKDGEKFLVTVVMETFLKADTKKSQKHYVYNTYFVLINAGLHFKAEMMRINFLKSHGIDLRKESLKGDDDGAEPNNSTEPISPTS
jgi:hypothetical protein